VLVVVGASNNTLGVSPFLFYFLDGSKKHINLIDNNLKTIWLRLCRAGKSVDYFGLICGLDLLSPIQASFQLLGPEPA
jgi:hypothetical protein